MRDLAELIEFYPESWKNANAYLLHIGDGLLIDPGLPMPEEARDKVHTLLATHAHYDHLAGLDSWLEVQGSRFVCPGADAPLLDDAEANASKLFAHSRSFPQPDHWIEDGESLNFGENFRLECWHTPGHTPGSSCFLLFQKTQAGEEKVMALFTGDTLFADSVGRSDLLGGNPIKMKESIELLRERLSALPPDLAVFPGHGQADQAGNILSKNPFMRQGGFFAL